MHAPWINPYIPLIKSSALIAAAGPKSDPEALREATKVKLAKYSSIACELGSGAGKHIITQAQNHPETLWVGFELRYKRIYLTAQRAEKRNISNMLLINSDARNILSIFPPNSISAIYLNFPDPWEKKRLRKHRIATKEFLVQCHDILHSDGIFSFKSDHREYFEQVLKFFEGLSEYRIEKLSFDLHKSEWALGNIISEFEMLFASKGLPVFYLEAKKLGKIDS